MKNYVKLNIIHKFIFFYKYFFIKVYAFLISNISDYIWITGILLIGYIFAKLFSLCISGLES